MNPDFLLRAVLASSLLRTFLCSSACIDNEIMLSALVSRTHFVTFHPVRADLRFEQFELASNRRDESVFPRL